MKSPVLVLALMLCPLVAICTAQHAIVQPYHNAAHNIWSYSPIGQTFTALDARISTIGIRLENVWPTTATVTYQLFEGEGNSGPLLGSSTFSVPPGERYFDRDFSSVTLTPGQTYTVMISDLETDCCLVSDEQWAYGDGTPISGTADYPGGQMIFRGVPKPYSDIAFHLEPVPEPNSLVVVMIGVGLCFSRRDGVRPPKPTVNK